MNQESYINPLRINVSMAEEFHKKMKDYSKEKGIPFSSLVKNALKLYSDDDGNCFVELARQHSGSEAADISASSFEKHGITQSHFLGHLIRSASTALQELKDGQDWHEIKCILQKESDKKPDPSNDPEVQELAKKFIENARRNRRNKDAGDSKSGTDN